MKQKKICELSKNKRDSCDRAMYEDKVHFLRPKLLSCNRMRRKLPVARRTVHTGRRPRGRSNSGDIPRFLYPMLLKLYRDCR